MQIGELARRIGVAPTALRYYEKSKPTARIATHRIWLPRV